MVIIQSVWSVAMKVIVGDDDNDKHDNIGPPKDDCDDLRLTDWPDRGSAGEGIGG